MPFTVAMAVPPRLIVYLVTPAASVDAIQVRLIRFEPIAEAVRPVGAVGAVVSPSALVVALALELAALVFPAASDAVTV